MKVLLSFFLSCLLTIFVHGQTTPINPSRAVIGSASSSLPSDPEAQNIPLVIWNNATTGFYSPTFQMGSPNGRFTVAVANEIGAYGAIAKGDIVFRTTNGTRMIHNLNTSNEFNTRKVMFGTQQNNFRTLVVSNGDKVGMGTETFPSNDPNFRLYVKGGIKAQEVKVELCNGWCDYVFNPNYNLVPLSEVKSFIETNKHLPNIPSAATLEKEEGFELGKMTTLQQEKIEELYLYVIQLDEKIKKLEKENEELKSILKK